MFFGRFTKQKNLFSLLDAVKITKSKIIIIGEGPMKKQLLEKVGNQDIDCTFHDRVDQKELKTLLEIAQHLFYHLTMKATQSHY